MFAFLMSVVMYLVAPSAPAPLSLPIDSQSLDFCPSAPSNTLECDDKECEKSEWDMLSVALAMYKSYWVELRKKEADGSPSKRRRIEVMPSPLCVATPSHKSPMLWAVLGVRYGMLPL